MELIKAIYQRRSCRDFTPAPVPHPLLMDLLRAAVQAPSGMDAQPWSFAVIEGPSRLKDYSDRAKMHFLRVFDPGRDPHAMHREPLADPKYNLFYNASTLVVVYAMPKGQFASVDCCLAAENLMLAAVDKGLATCPIGFAQGWFETAEVKAELRVPVDYTAVLPIIVGYPAGITHEVSRKEPDISSWT